VLSDFSIAPIVIGRQSKKGIDGLSNALKSLEHDDRTILVASTDWQHYKPASIGAPMDSLGIACLLDLDPDRLAGLLATEEVQMCGGGAAVAVTRAALARGADRAVLLRYGHSGEVSGDHSSVVGYAAIVLYKHVDKAAKGPPNGDDHKEAVVKNKEPYQLSDSDKNQLLQIARRSIAGYLRNGELPTFDVAGILADPGAAFVTLEKKDRLRGCIGYTQAIKPLYRTVSECAVKAAAQDSRFQPVTSEELPELHIEISVLTPLEKIESLDEIEVGRDGLMIALGNRRGLLLPQVAVENGWDRTTFLEKTCWKAGLPEDAYKSPDAVIYKYEALIFGE
jgi:AmmeMemoRadiSam system protein A